LKLTETVLKKEIFKHQITATVLLENDASHDYA